MKEIGCSSKYFYYTQSERGTFNIRLHFDFKEEIDLDLLKQSVNSALRFFPELKVRPVICNNRIMYEENENEVVFLYDDGSNHNFGSDEINGYLMYFLYKDKRIVLSYYHALTDVGGMVVFAKTFLNMYGKSVRDNWEDKVEGARFSINDYDNGIIEELEKPYEYFARDVKPDYVLENPGAYVIKYNQYDEKIDCTHEFEIQLDANKLFLEVKRQGVSYASFVNTIISSKIREMYDVGDDIVISMMPANVRRLFDTKSICNLSDGILIPFYKEDEKLSFKEKCVKCKDYINKQNTRNNFEKVFYDKCKTVEQFENMSYDLRDFPMKEMFVAEPGEGCPMTYVLSISGKISFSEEIDNLLEDTVFGSAFNAGLYAVEISSFKEKCKIQIIARTDDTDFVKGIYEEFCKVDEKAKFVDLGKVVPDQLKINKLKVVEEA